MKKILCLACLSLSFASAEAQMHKYNTDFNMSRHDFCDTIQIVYEDDQIYVPVEINGQKRMFTLDTGSSQGTIYSSTPIDGCRELGNVVSHDANNNSDTVKVVTIPPFTMGKVSISNYVASVFPKPLTGKKSDGIIGFDLFNKGLSAKIDAQKGIMIITDKRNAFDTEPGFSIKYKLKWFVPYILVSPFIRHDDEVLFDTGSRQLYTINKQSFDKHVYKSKNVSSQIEGVATGNLSIGHFGPEKKDKVVFLHLDRLKWDEFSFNNLRTTTSQGSSRIGAQIMKYGCIIICPQKKILIFQPYDNTDCVTINNKQFGVAFVPTDGKASVGLVFDKSEAYKNGMRQGDTIIAINGKQIVTFEDFVRFPFVKGRRYTFNIISQDGTRKTVNVAR